LPNPFVCRNAYANAARHSDATPPNVHFPSVKPPASVPLKAPNYRFVASPLKNGLESKADAATIQTEVPLTHANVRGPSFYH
jgi:hypothetical protein